MSRSRTPETSDVGESLGNNKHAEKERILLIHQECL